MSFKFFDAHCHLQFEDYAKDREQVIGRMREEGVAGIVVGTGRESSRAAVALAESHDHLFASVGIHPHYVQDIVSPSSDDGLTMSIIRELAQHPKCVVIGECGLDYFRGSHNKPEQKELFQAHVTLAQDLDKPLIIHCRPSRGTMDAYEDLISILQKTKIGFPHLRGDVHFFVGGLTAAEALLALNFTLSFTAVITFARDYDQVIRSVPLTSILAETDAPYVAPVARRGERNDPLAIRDVVAKIAEIRGEEFETVRNALAENARKLINLY